MKAKIQHEIQEYCNLLRLNAISEHFEEAIAGATDYEGFLHQLLRMEVDAEEERAKERKIKAAKFPYRKYIEDLEMDLLPEGMRNRLPELCSLDFIREGKNVIMTGNPGTGKTHTAIGLGIKACEQGYRVLYTTIPYLVTELKESNSKQKLRTYQKRFEKYDLIIADELGYISFDREAADLLFSALSMSDPVKAKTELRPLLGTRDFFKIIVVSKSSMKPWTDEDGIVHLGLYDFLLNEDLINM